MYYNWSSDDQTGEMLLGYSDRAIEQDLNLRMSPPNHVFCYPLVDSWRSQIWDLLSEYITDEVKVEFVRQSPKWVDSENLSWLNTLILKVTGEHCDIQTFAEARIREKYRAFRAVHGTRTNDLSRFYVNGLRYLRPDEIEDRARSIFLNGQSAYASEDRLQKGIDEIDARRNSGGRERRLYFFADEQSLMSREGGAGHYLVYGSEYLFCIGTYVAGTRETKKALKSIGRPTVFVCDIPMELIENYALREFVGMIIEYLFCELVDGLECRALSAAAGSALVLRSDLPANFIVGHYHPTTVYDPLWLA